MIGEPHPSRLCNSRILLSLSALEAIASARLARVADAFMISIPRNRWPGRIALLVVILGFCVPLFVGLDGLDLGNDEAIYSYSVLRILETGDWLTPRAIPFDGPFLEKPPLKFWLVAAPMALHVLPPDEFGLRAMDALLGGVAFVYVFLLGRWQSGAVGGITAVLVLYTFAPLLFEHGLRSNNMEAMMVLCYTGGVYHFARWLDGGGAGSAARHRWGAALYFTAGFLTKFVAILFLPLICLAALLLRSGPRPSRWWRAWLGPAALFALLSAPWFVYQTLASGRLVWDVLFWQHVYTRFTGALDVHHLQPWDYYVSTLWLHSTDAGSEWIALAGLVALVIAAFRRDGWLARVFLFWGMVPIALLSLGSSKLFHYIYPFLPPAALGAGCAAAIVFGTTTNLFAKHVAPRIRRLIPRTADSSRLAVRTSGQVLIGLAMLSAVVGIVTAVYGDVNWKVGDLRVFRNASLTRPLLLAAVFLFLAGELRWTARSLGTALLVMILPVAAYSKTLERSIIVDRPLHVARDCLLDVRRSGEAVGHTVYDTATSSTNHPYNFYFRGFEPWTRSDEPDRSELRRRLIQPGGESPVITTDAGYVDAALAVVSSENGGSRLPLVGIRADHDLIVLLPGPYARCAPRAARAGGAPVGFVVKQTPSR